MDLAGILSQCSPPSSARTPARHVPGEPPVSDRLTPAEFAQDRKTHLTGRLIRVKDVGQRGAYYWRCEAATAMPEGEYPKVLVLERWRLERIEGELLYPGTE